MTAPHGFATHRDAIAAGRLLRVVNYHYTPTATAASLREELAAYAAGHVGVDADGVGDFFDAGRWPDDRPRFAPVFYEGYADHVEVAAPVCEELGLTAWFAVCTGFVDCVPAEQEAFARSHFIAVSSDEQDGRRLAMTWDEVAVLARRHVVFAHTASHDGIAETVTDADLEREVYAPKRELDRRTGVVSAAFAWMGGSPWGGHPRHDEAVRSAGYRLVVSNTMIQRIA